MFSRRLEWIGVTGNEVLLQGGLRGVEKETLRVTDQGALSMAPHPKVLGSALTHPSITTDYSEALLELVTPPHRSNWQTLQQLCDIHSFLHRSLDGELLWPMSMPCKLGGDLEIPIADYGTSNAGMMRTVYRRGLGHRYGRSMQAIAGVHFNYSPPIEFWPAFQDAEGDAGEIQAFRSTSLMGLVRNYYRYAWMVIYLFGASPAFSKSFLPSGNSLLASLDAETWYGPHATSLRMSDIGYQNKTQARLQISVNSLDDYLLGLTAAITTEEPRYADIGIIADGDYQQLNANVLQIENEYYSTIRPKPSKAAPRTTIGLREHGVEYVEVRTLDLSPADPIGMNQNQLRFLEVLLLFCLLEDSPPIDPSEQQEISARNLSVAREGRRTDLQLPIGSGFRLRTDIVAQFRSRLLAVAAVLDGDGGEYSASVAAHLRMLEEPELTPSAVLMRELRETGASFEEYGLEVARQHHAYFLSLQIESNKLLEFQREAAASLDTARRLEQQDVQRFSEYLGEFLQRV